MVFFHKIDGSFYSSIESNGLVEMQEYIYTKSFELSYKWPEPKFYLNVLLMYFLEYFRKLIEKMSKNRTKSTPVFVYSSRRVLKKNHFHLISHKSLLFSLTRCNVSNVSLIFS